MMLLTLRADCSQNPILAITMKSIKNLIFFVQFKFFKKFFLDNLK